MNRRIFLSTLLAPFVARWRKWFPKSERPWVPTPVQAQMLGLNARYLEWYSSEAQAFQFGFTGYRRAMLDSDDIATGQFLFGGNLIVTTPRSVFKLSGLGTEEKS